MQRSQNYAVVIYQLRRRDDPLLREELMQFIVQLDVKDIESIIRAFNTFYVISYIVEVIS